MGSQLLKEFPTNQQIARTTFQVEPLLPYDAENLSNFSAYSPCLISELCRTVNLHFKIHESELYHLLLVTSYII